MPAVAQRFARVPYRSVLVGVADTAWDSFVFGMSARKIRDVSRGGGIGSFDLRPRRLGEIGVMANLRREGRVWVGDLTPPYANLRQSPSLQRQVFEKSMSEYDEDLRAMARPVDGASRSGCLAILHCGGVGALEKWPAGAFKTTKLLFDRVNNLF